MRVAMPQSRLPIRSLDQHGADALRRSRVMRGQAGAHAANPVSHRVVEVA
jgi:hypothetical protein